MTITASDLQREARISYLKQSIASCANQRDQQQMQIMKLMKELADLLGMDVIGEAICERPQ